MTIHADGVVILPGDVIGMALVLEIEISQNRVNYLIEAGGEVRWVGRAEILRYFPHDVDPSDIMSKLQRLRSLPQGHEPDNSLVSVTNKPPERMEDLGRMRSSILRKLAKLEELSLG